MLVGSIPLALPGLPAARNLLLQAAKTEKEPELRLFAIGALAGNTGTPELWQLYQTETTTEGKLQLLRYMYSNSNAEKLLEVVWTEKDPKVRALKESDAYPAMAERGYGWEKLISEMFCEEYWHERGMKTAIARFHNVYGPHGTWDGGREKAPAALCRKVIEAIETGKKDITIWGNGSQTRSFMYIDDCVQGIDKIMHCDDLIATPINLGSSELVSINELLTKIEKIAGVKMNRKYDLNAPQGVAGRNSDNTFIKKTLKWEPNTTLNKGLAETYAWIRQQYKKRKAGERVGVG